MDYPCRTFCCCNSPVAIWAQPVYCEVVSILGLFGVPDYALQPIIDISSTSLLKVLLQSTNDELNVGQLQGYLQNIESDTKKVSICVAENVPD